MIALGGIIGAGLFVGSSAAIATVGPAILVSYALTGTIVFLVMRMVSEMALALPGTGTFVDFARAGLGDWAGFVTGWLYWFFWIVVIPVEAIAAASLLEPMLGLPVWLTGLLLIVAMTLTNLRSARSYGEFEFWFASIKVAALIAFIVIAAVYVIRTPIAGGRFSNLTAHGGFAPFGLPSVLAGVTSVIFTLVGAEIATIAAAESIDPERAVARLTVTLVFRVTFFYVLSIFLILCIVPWQHVIPGKSPFVAALNVIGIPGAALVMDFLVLTAALSALNSALYVTSRTLFTLAAHGDAPSYLVGLNTRRVPVRSIGLSALLGIIGVITSITSPRVVFAFLINASGAVMLFVYLVTALAQVSNRYRLEATHPQTLRLKMWLFPWLSYGVVTCIAGILIMMACDRALASQFYLSAMSLLVALVAYRLRKSPVRTIGPQ
jgi:AAT family amino acid transporter/GABA permease